ncbi:PTS sugar transporter subunit IIA [Clostridioides difficile]
MFKKLFSKNRDVKLNKEVSNTILKSPISGRILSIEEVPDDTFAGKLLGEGLAINPVEGVVYSPVDGEIVQLFMPSKHAICIKSNDGIEILIHIGIDTVKMNGNGFDALVNTGDKVKLGQELIRFDIDKIKQNAKTITTPIVITNTHELKNINIIANQSVVVGDDLIKIYK